MSEDRYEAIELVIKERSDGRSWFDVLEELISQDCTGGGGDCITSCGCERYVEECEDCMDCDDHEHTELFPCTCGLESMGGMSGTLNQCFKWLMPDEEWEEDWDGDDSE